MMMCATCGGNAKESMTVYYTHYQGYLITVKNVPGHECSQCGERWYSIETLKRVDELVEEEKKTIDKNIILDYAA